MALNASFQGSVTLQPLTTKIKKEERKGGEDGGRGLCTVEKEMENQSKLESQ